LHLNEMRYQRPILLPLSLVTSMVLVALLFYPASPVTSQTPNKNLNANIGRPSRQAIQLPPRPAPTPTPESSTEVVTVDVDLVKPVDEIPVMAFTDSTKMVQPFTRNRILIEQALNNIPEPAKTTNVAHCFNLMFAEAAEHMLKASNPAGRRVIIVITSMTRL